MRRKTYQNRNLRLWPNSIVYLNIQWCNFYVGIELPSSPALAKKWKRYISALTPS